MANNYNFLFKYIIIGDPSVGKSNLLMRYAHNKFTDEYQATIGVEFGAKNIEVDDQVFRIQIWDTAGQENFRSITRAYYKNSVCALVVYDISNRSSFESMESWIEDVRNQSPKTVTIILIGNKCDLESERKVTYEEGEIFAKENRVLFFEASAKTGKNVDELFKQSAQVISKQMDDGYYDLTSETCGIKKGTRERTVLPASTVVNSNTNNKTATKNTLATASYNQEIKGTKTNNSKQNDNKPPQNVNTNPECKTITLTASTQQKKKKKCACEK